MKPQYAWKITNLTLDSAIENYSHLTVKYIPNQFVGEVTANLGLFVFKTRKAAREFISGSKHNYHIWKAEVIGLQHSPYSYCSPYRVWPDGTMFCKQVKLLHKQ